MAQPLTAAHARRIELPLREVRSRLSQLVRMAGLTGQVTVVVDEGRPLAEIRPVSPDSPGHPPADRPPGDRPPGRDLRAVPPSRAVSAEPAAPGASAAGWLRRLDKVREDLKRQHAAREAELVHALDEAWQLLDGARPPGTDRAADLLRGAHRPLRERRAD